MNRIPGRRMPGLRRARSGASLEGELAEEGRARTRGVRRHPGETETVWIPRRGAARLRDVEESLLDRSVRIEGVSRALYAGGFESVNPAGRSGRGCPGDDGQRRAIARTRLGRRGRRQFGSGSAVVLRLRGRCRFAAAIRRVGAGHPARCTSGLAVEWERWDGKDGPSDHTQCHGDCRDAPHAGRKPTFNAPCTDTPTSPSHGLPGCPLRLPTNATFLMRCLNRIPNLPRKEWGVGNQKGPSRSKTPREIPDIHQWRL
jgi:hypothetical protein